MRRRLSAADTTVNDSGCMPVPVSTSCAPGGAMSIRCASSGRPTHSKITDGARPVWRVNSATGSACATASMTTPAPMRRARARRAGTRSLSPMSPAPKNLAHLATDSPMMPAPTTSTSAPAGTLAAFHAPSPTASGSMVAASTSLRPSGIFIARPAMQLAYSA